MSALDDQAEQTLLRSSVWLLRDGDAVGLGFGVEGGVCSVVGSGPRLSMPCVQPVRVAGPTTTIERSATSWVGGHRVVIMETWH